MTDTRKTDIAALATRDREQRQAYDAAFDAKLAEISAIRTPTAEDYETMREAARNALGVQA